MSAPCGKVLEIGAATGAYTLPLLKRGVEVTTVDLSYRQSFFCQERLHDAGFHESAQHLLSDVRYLGLERKACFDAALLMGPLYHLVEAADRRQALGQVFQRLKPGGMIFSAFISRFGILGGLIRYSPGWIENWAGVESVLENGRSSVSVSENFRGYFAKVEEIAPLHESLGFESLELVGVEPAISADDERYNRLEGRHRKLWLDLMERISGEESILGASRHLLYIGRKPDDG